MHLHFVGSLVLPLFLYSITNTACPKACGISSSFHILSERIQHLLRRFRRLEHLYGDGVWSRHFVFLHGVDRRHYFLFRYDVVRVS